MPPRRPPDPPPPCYATVQPGLEEVAADEITRDFNGDVRKVDRGFVIFRAEISPDLLKLRTVEDVFLFAWGTDSLTYRAADLDLIRKWTDREPDWPRLLQLHHQVRPKPKGKPTWHVVTQMIGEHGYRRTDARDAFRDGLAGKVPGSWRIVDEDASLEIWLTIHGQTAICGVRLSDQTMRHREYKVEHRPASLRPSVAAAMARLAGAGPGDVVLDPMCGAGTILAEHLDLSRRRRLANPILGGDLDRQAVEASGFNLRKLGPTHLARWDARRLPLPDASVDRIVSNPPFGVQLSDPESVGPLYDKAVAEFDRVLRPGGRVVLLAADAVKLRSAVAAVGWRSHKQLRLRVLGQSATLGVWKKADESATMQESSED